MFANNERRNLKFHMSVDKGCRYVVAGFFFQFRPLFLYRYDLKFGKIPRNVKNPKIEFLRILVMKLSNY